MDANGDQPILAELELRAASGPTQASCVLHRPIPVTIGRRSAHALQLKDPAISRDHARINFRPVHKTGQPDAGEWLLDDVGSTHGTWLNGVRIRPGRQYHLRPGDLLALGPWTFRVVDRKGLVRSGTTLATVDQVDLVGTVVARLDMPPAKIIAQQETHLLLRCSERIHEAHTDTEIAQAVVEVAVAGTDFTRAAFLRPVTDSKVAEVVASTEPEASEELLPRLSGALLQEAANGSPVSLQRGIKSDSDSSAGENRGQIMALCLPIMVGSMLAGFVYLDTPRNQSGRGLPDPEFGSLAIGLTRLAAMGMANLMRIDVALRHERMEAELRAAAEARRWLMPGATGRAGPYRFNAGSRAGRQIGGDFYDVVPFGDDRLALAFGDVGGSGVPVSLLVSAAIGFLNACAANRLTPAQTAERIDRLFSERISHEQFLKLWLGVLDLRERTLSYVDAGHGHAMTFLPDGRCELLCGATSPPISVKEGVEYRQKTVSITSATGLLLVSDGFVGQISRQPAADSTDDSSADNPKVFGISQVQAAVRALPADGDPIGALFAALETHAGTPHFDDDASVLMVRW